MTRPGIAGTRGEERDQRCVDWPRCAAASRLYVRLRVDRRAVRRAGTVCSVRLAAQSRRPIAQGRLFPPQDLGLLEAPDRDEWQKPDQIMDALAIADGSTVADIGAGAGWFTIRLARRVGPNGIVYAQDVQRQMLEAIRRRVEREGLQNVETRLGTGSTPNLPAGTLDAVLVVDVYHEVDDRVTFLRNLADGAEAAAAGSAS